MIDKQRLEEKCSTWNIALTGTQLDQLDASQFWLAEYDTKPDFFYDFEMWQYTHTGVVPGIQGNVDLNLAFQRN